MTSLSCSTPAARLVSQGRDADAWQTSWQHAAVFRVDRTRVRGRQERSSPRCRCITSALTANCLVFMHAWRPQIHRHPRDMPGFVKELANFRFTASPGVNNPLNGGSTRRDFDQTRFSKGTSRSAEAWPCNARVAERWKKLTGVDAGRSHDCRDIASGMHESARQWRSTTARSDCRWRPPRFDPG